MKTEAKKYLYLFDHERDEIESGVISAETYRQAMLATSLRLYGRSPEFWGRQTGAIRSYLELIDSVGGFTHKNKEVVH